MDPAIPPQLISYIAPGAPARRRPATGAEAFLRAEIGFTPHWFRSKLGIDFGERWHTDPAYRRESVRAMRAELARRFPGSAVGGIDRPEHPLDLLTGTYGGSVVAGIYGVPLVYAPDNWPNCEKQYLTDVQAERLEPPDLDGNPLFQDLMRQVEWIATHERRVEGYVNWQGVLNNAHRLRGEALFTDLIEAPERARRLFACVCATMIEAEQRLHARQRASGVAVGFTTISNCLVNLIAPRQYAELLLPFDQRIAGAFASIGVHNCAWRVDPYLEHYARIPRVGYIDMGLASHLPTVRALFPSARRAVMITPTEFSEAPAASLQDSLQRVAAECGPCDVVAADLETGTPDETVRRFLACCEELGRAVARDGGR
jgi:hypothetical protein